MLLCLLWLLLLLWLCVFPSLFSFLPSSFLSVLSFFCLCLCWPRLLLTSRGFSTHCFCCGLLRCALPLQSVLKPVVLRRTKEMKDVDGRAIVNLPPKTIQNICVPLSEAERSFYHVRARA